MPKGLEVSQIEEQEKGERVNTAPVVVVEVEVELGQLFTTMVCNHGATQYLPNQNRFRVLLRSI